MHDQVFILQIYNSWIISGICCMFCTCSGNNLCDYSNGLWSEWGWHLLFLNRDIVNLAGAAALTIITHFCCHSTSGVTIIFVNFNK